MASGFFAILDDIAALMDDVSVTAKVATQKTAGILGDDLAVNAEKATGFLSSREIPVLMKIMKGSFINKLIIIPIIFLLEWLFPPLITWILILGGFYLAYEGVEKIFHYLFHKNKDAHEVIAKIEEPGLDGEKLEAEKIKSAITTDFILSLEIIIIALATAKDSFNDLKSEYDPFLIEVVTVSIVAIIATVGVYGIVALIVRMDDAGYKLIKRSSGNGFLNNLGEFLVKALPWVIKGLAFIGTIALILVAGGIFVHNIDAIHHFVLHQLERIPTIISEALFGILGGLIAFAMIWVGKQLLSIIKN